MTTRNNPAWRNRRAQGIVFASALLFWTFASAGAEDDSCLTCHANKTMTAPQMAADKFKSSAHKDLGCTACHADKDEYPHKAKASTASCETCHPKSAQDVQDSDHGQLLLKTKKGAAFCLACHNPVHEILPVKDPASSVSHSNIPATCNQCHRELDFKEKFGMDPLDSYTHTVHGKASLEGKNSFAAVCTDCHGGHDLNFSNNSRSRAYKFNIPQTCGRCHPEPLKAYSRSFHGVKSSGRVKEAPVCTDCHGEHNIQPRREPGSMVYTGSIVKTCSHCHASERLIAKFGMPLDYTKTYLDSYHGVAFVAGNLSSANCASCHGHHDVLPPSDPQSSVNPQNLQKTCGACHPKAGELVHLGKVHVTFSTVTSSLRDTFISLVHGASGTDSASRESLTNMVRMCYIYIIFFTIGGMLLHNLLDHIRKMLLGPARTHDPHALRMSLNERIQHLILLVSFIGLAYTGFCHTYPDAFLARIAFHGASGASLRALLHRILAMVFILLSAYHVYWLALTPDGRQELDHMMPRWKDFLDFLQLQRCNLLHRGAPPKFDRFSYMEKAEYWALIWGSIVMVTTGCVVWFRELSLQFFSKWFIDLCLLIHFMEAILACLAILVWHLYWTIFDPEVYPMNWAWLTGKVQRDASNRGTEHDQQND